MKHTFLVLLLLFIATLQSWADFAYYSPVTINPGQVPSTLTDYAERIYQVDARLKTVANGGYVQDAQGDDIRPYTDSGGVPGTAITGYEKVFYDGTTGTLEMYVKRSSLADGTVTQLTYGDASLTTDDSSTTTWSNNFIAIYHLKDGILLSLVDSLGSHNGSNGGVATATTGQIDGGISLVSTSSQFVNTGSYSNTAAMTISAWVKATTFPSAQNSVFLKNSVNTTYAGLFVRSDGKLSFQSANGGVTVVSYDGTGANTLSTGTWYYLSAAYDSTSGLSVYVNTTLDKTIAANGAFNTTTSQQTDIGRDNVNGRYWNGSMDEVRVASVFRSVDWRTTEYNEGFPATFETLGTQVSLSTWGRNSFFFSDP